MLAAGRPIGGETEGLIPAVDDLALMGAVISSSAAAPANWSVRLRRQLPLLVRDRVHRTCTFGRMSQ
ncbi:hypothetical protein ACXX9E_29325 [Pseudomonas sp. GNP014]